MENNLLPIEKIKTAYTEYLESLGLPFLFCYLGRRSKNNKKPEYFPIGTVIEVYGQIWVKSKKGRKKETRYLVKDGNGLSVCVSMLGKLSDSEITALLRQKKIEKLFQ